MLSIFYANDFPIWCHRSSLVGQDPPHFVPALPPLLWELLSLVEFINCMHDAMEVKGSKKKKDHLPVRLRIPNLSEKLEILALGLEFSL